MDFSSLLSWTVHVLGVAIPVALTLVFYNGTLFSLHVMAMSTTFLLMLPEGLLLAVKSFKSKNRARLMRLHVSFQFSSLFLAMTGLAAQFWHRQVQGKSHFKDFHSKLGVAAILAIQAVAFVGVLLYYAIPKAKRTQYPRVLLFHRLGGRAVYLLGIFTLLEGLQIFNPAHKRHKGWITYVIACAVLAQAAGMFALVGPYSAKPSKREGASRSSLFKSPADKSPLQHIVSHRTDDEQADASFMDGDTKAS